MTNTLIHPSAIIDDSAQLGDGLQVGPYSIIGKNVRIGNNVKIASHVVLEDNISLADDCQVGVGAILGGAPQDLGYKGEPTQVIIGRGSFIGEYVTVNRASGEGKATTVGEDCMLMAYSHLGHNCKLANGVIIANSVQVGGYVQIDDYAFLGGVGAFHQHIRIGTMCITAGMSGSRKDLSPFAKYDGRPATFRGMNSIGLRRKGVSAQSRQNLRRAFGLLSAGGMNQGQALEAIKNEIEADPFVSQLIDFFESSTRGVSIHHRQNWGAEESVDVLDAPTLATVQ